MRYELLGVGIEVEGDAAAPLAAALAPLSAHAVGPAALRFVARRVEAPPTAPPAPAVFVHEPVRGGRAGRALVLGDGRARFEIDAAGARVDAALAPDALGAGAAEVQALHVPIALAFALRHHRVFHLHAGVVAQDDRAVLVPGQAHVGKTTLALALCEAGLTPVCDDAAFLADLGGAPRVQGLARAWHLRPDTLRAFPAAAPRGSSATAPLVPALAVFPEIAPRPQTRVEPVEPAEALGRLVEASALVVVDGAARAPEHLALLGRIASEVPAVRVALGRDLLETPAAVARALLRAAGW